MKLTVIIIPTTMGVEFEINHPGVMAGVIKKADEILRAPKIKKDRGKVYLESGDRYFLYIPARNKVIFHKCHHARVKGWIVNEGIHKNIDISFEEKTLEPYEPFKVDFDNYGFDMEVPPEATRFFYQNELVEFGLDPDRLQTIVEVQPGRGKGVCLSEPLLTPDGWRLMGDITVGEKVVSRDGYPTEVRGVYPQPDDLDIYEVTSYDGRKCKVDGEHLWQSFYPNTTNKQRWRVRDTVELKRLLSLPNPRVYIPLPEPVRFNPIQDPLPINPYLLGVAIGDGCIKEKGVVTLGLNKNHGQIIDGFKDKEPRIGRMNIRVLKDGRVILVSFPDSPLLHKGFRDLGLEGKRSWEKFIPKRYMTASVHERWELMRGLMDTDGTVNKDGGQPSYCTTSKQLALDVQELAWSLGGIASISERQPHFTYKGERKPGRTAYNVFLRFPKPSMLFNLDEKKALVRDNGQYAHRLKVRIRSIEKVESEPSQCIAVDAPDELYIAKNYLVTHNTKSSQKIMVRKGVRTCIIVKPSYMDKWEFDCVKDKTGLRVKDRHVRLVHGVDGVVQLVKDGLSGKLDRDKTKIIILPTVTMQLFIKDFCANPNWYDFELRDFYRILGVGEVLYDEIHEHFLTVYLTGICLSPPSTIEMSATLEPGATKEFIRQRYLERFPKNSRFTVDYIPCVDGRGVYYHIQDNHVLSRVNRMVMYNNNNFEKLLIQNKMLNSYFEMVYDIFKKTMYPNYDKGQKALFLFSLIETCTRFRDFIERKTREDGYKFKVVKYNGGDSFDAFIAADIAVSTPGKAGTAVDVPGLANMYITTAIDDRQLNEQMAGRPRPLIQWNMNPRAWFFHCMEIKKHCSYLNSRLRSLEDKMLSFKIIDTPHVLRRTDDNASRFTARAGAVSRNVPKKLSRVHISGISGGRKRPPKPRRR